MKIYSIAQAIHETSACDSLFLKKVLEHDLSHRTHKIRKFGQIAILTWEATMEARVARTNMGQ